MKYLFGDEKEKALKCFDEAINIAKMATCKRSKCGAIIVKDNEIIGIGFNSPAGNIESQRRCLIKKDSYHLKVTDKTCCVHAEQRAIMDALRRNQEKLEGSKLYFIRLDDNNLPLKSGEPYCTICSKMALDVGVKEFILLQEKGVCVYDTEEYNRISFDYNN